MAVKKFNALPGFRLTMGVTLFFLSTLVLIPFAGLFLRVAEVCWHTPALDANNTQDLPELVDRLKSHEDPVSAFVWERFSEPARQQLAAPDAAGKPDVQQILLTELNHLLHSRPLYDTKRFADVTLSPKANWLLHYPVSTAWLNRTLLEDAFPSNIKKKTSWLDLWLLATNERAMAAYRLTFGASALAAVANALFGTLLAWVLARYEFPGRRFIDAMVDFPFALPTAVAGLTLANLFAANGWLGKYLVPLGFKGAYTPLGVVIALTFVGMPFVVRTLQPVLESLEQEVEEAAATLGAGRLRTFVSVIAPSLFPAILTGFALAFARAIGEYGSVVFISGNLPFKTEIAPYLIVVRLEEYDYTGAIALAVVLLIFSFLLLIVINLLEQWASRFQHPPH
jgi:sulfate transport system permease protein